MPTNIILKMPTLGVHLDKTLLNSSVTITTFGTGYVQHAYGSIGMLNSPGTTTGKNVKN